MTFQKTALYALLTFSLVFPSHAINQSAPQVLDGLWNGWFDINNQGQYDFTALYLGGRVSAYSVGSNVVYRGTVIGDDKQYQSDMVMYIRDGTQFGTVQLKGTVGEGATSIIARYLTTGKDTGTLGLVYNPLFERPVDPSAIEGLWEFTSKEISNISFNVSPAGEIKGTDSVGCNYTGTLKPVRNGINALEVTLELSSCSTADGHYEGMAYVETGEAGNVLHMAVTGNLFGLYYPFAKVSTSP